MFSVTDRWTKIITSQPYGRLALEVYTNNGKTVTKSYTWNGWTEALKRYGPGAKDPEYQNKINKMKDESVEPKASDY
jgi:hypothetical protein